LYPATDGQQTGNNFVADTRNMLTATCCREKSGFSFSRFGFIVQTDTDRITDAAKRLLCDYGRRD